MKRKYYTKDNRHPEDAIFEAKMFINELTNVQESYFVKLLRNLDLNEEATNWLFDYIHNSGEEGSKIDFEEYLEQYGKKYGDFVEKNIHYVPANELAQTETDLLYSEEVESVFEDDILKPNETNKI